jgi:cell wall-associated NlpC family hydrolase
MVNGAAADTAALAPFTGSPAGQQALLTALRARVAHQQKVLAAYKARDAKMAALLRSMSYAARAPGGAGVMPFGGGGRRGEQAGLGICVGRQGTQRVDCSGLTQWAWAQAGVRLGPDTYTQVDQGVPVAPGDVRAGDLIFPRYSFDGRGRGHVQLAISPTEVVHAPQSGDVVRIAPMPAAYVARRPVPPGAGNYCTERRRGGRPEV